MTDAVRQLTRQQLTQFLRDHQAVRTFERMQQQAIVDTPADVAALTLALEEASVLASTVDARLSEAIAASNRLSEAIESLLAAAPPLPVAEMDDLLPPARESVPADCCPSPVAREAQVDDVLLPTVRELTADDNLAPPPLQLTGGMLATIIGGALAANPTGTIGLAAVNGTLTTYLRSDAAPALSQAIVPTWSAQHTFTASAGAAVLANTGGPILRMSDTDAAVDTKHVRVRVLNGALSISSEDDTLGSVTTLMATSRTAAAWTNIAWGNTTDNPTYSFLGTGTATFSGQVTALRFVPTSATVATNGLYLPSANNPALSANSTKVIEWTSTLVTVTGNVSLGTAGNKLLVKEGTNASMGVATLVAGTVTVNTTLVTASSRIFLSVQSLGTVAVATPIAVTARTAGTSFTITSSAITDTSVIAWHIVEPA